MKKLVSIFLVLALIFSLAACGKSDEKSSTSEAGSSVSNVENSGETSEKSLTKVIYIGGARGDAGIADATYLGFERAIAELAIEGSYVEMPSDPSTYKATLLEACDAGAELIFTSAINGMVDEVISIAPDYPEVKFMVLDTSLGQEGIDKLDNFTGILCSQNEVSFLAGYLAMKMSESDKVGIVVGVEYPTLSDFITGYISGAQHANPNAQVAVSASGDWDDQAAAKETALAQIRQGADVVYAVGAASSFGTLEAVKEAGVWGIGCDTDLAAQFVGIDDAQADVIISSAYKDWGTVSFNWIKDTIEAPETVAWGAVSVYGLANGGCKLIKNDIYEKQVPAELKEALNKLEAQIVSGEVKAPSYFDLSEDEYLTLKESVVIK